MLETTLQIKSLSNQVTLLLKIILISIITTHKLDLRKTKTFIIIMVSSQKDKMQKACHFKDKPTKLSLTHLIWKTLKVNLISKLLKKSIKMPLNK